MTGSEGGASGSAGERDRPLRLALETSSRLGGVAVGRGDVLLAESLLSVRATHSETVLPEVDRLLERCGLRPGDFDEVVVGAGPGSFTGVRIAAALAKGLCAATGARLRAFTSLAAVAAGSGQVGRVCVLVDARRDELYAAAWESAPGPEPSLGPLVARVDELLARLGGGGGWTFAGDGAVARRDALEERDGRVLPAAFAAPRPSSLLRLAHEFPSSGTVEAPATWEPAYLRPSGAERGV